MRTYVRYDTRMCDPAAGVDPFEELSTAVQRFIARTQDPDRTAAQVGEHLVLKRRIIDALELDFGRDAARFAATEEYDDQGFTSPISWLTNMCRMMPGPAGAAVCVGEQADTLACSVERMD